ncbi:MAG: hypothetical protein JXJ20_07910 [Anaerolineae bacterium]|nr:hypothetical protein [Anaerolineae bacterium]
MKQRCLIVGIVLVALCGAALAPVAAQDGLSVEEQAALDEVRATFEDFLALDTYSADLEQVITQNISASFEGEDVALEQVVTGEGEIQIDLTGEGEYDNLYMTLEQTIEQMLVGAGQEEAATIGPIMIEMIIVADRVYVQMSGEELAGMVPEGWVDVTEDASAYPGMEAFNFEQMLAMGSGLEADQLDALLSSVTGVELLGEDMLGDVAVNRYRLTMDPAQVLEKLGVEELSAMFESNALPFDVTALVEMIYTDEDTEYAFEVAIGVDDGVLYEHVQSMSTDIVLDSTVFTDPSLAGMEMIMAQETMQHFLFHSFNEPVTVTAPEVVE